jgi:acyl-CoA thioesterase
MQPSGAPLPLEVQEKLEVFERCEYARLNGIEIVSVDEGVVRVRMRHEGKMNAYGYVHGGAIYAMADHAFGVAANLTEPRQVAISGSIQYLAPAQDDLEAVAVRVDENEYSSVYHVQVFEGQRLIALFQGIGHKLKKGT